MNTKKDFNLADYIIDPPPPKKRGGPQPGSGAPKKPPEKKFKRAQITMTPEQFTATAKDRSGTVRRALDLYLKKTKKTPDKTTVTITTSSEQNEPVLFTVKGYED